MTIDLVQPLNRPTSRGLNVGLWSAQLLLFLTFVGTGLWKFLTPIPELSQKIAWTGQVPEAFVAVIAAVDLCGGIGVLLPSLTRVIPRLAVVAALGCATLMVAAIVFHIARGEAASTPFNGFLFGVCLFVAWGRFRWAPIAPRC